MIVFASSEKTMETFIRPHHDLTHDGEDAELSVTSHQACLSPISWITRPWWTVGEMCERRSFWFLLGRAWVVVGLVCYYLLLYMVQVSIYPLTSLLSSSCDIESTHLTFFTTKTTISLFRYTTKQQVIRTIAGTNVLTRKKLSRLPWWTSSTPKK